jgi:hypothetical protein
MDFEEEKSPLQRMGINVPDDLQGLFDDPPLLDGEDPNLYWGLFAAMIKERKPQSFSEWTYVHDMVSKLWEERRLKRASTGLMRGEMFGALVYFLRIIQSDGQEPEQNKQIGLPRLELTLSNFQPPPLTAAEKLAFKYFSKNPKERQEVISLLARYGITSAALQAKAAQQNSDAIQMFEAMIARREKGRRKLRREDNLLQSRQSEKGAKN